MLWLYLLGAVTFLVIALRRVLRRQKPLSDELYSSKVAIEHVHSGVGFVQGDGTFGFVNQSLANSLRAKPADLVGHEWLMMFPQRERSKAKDAYTQMLIQGIESLDTTMERSDGTLAKVHLRLVTAHDHKMRFLGHHCLILEYSRETELEAKIDELERELRKLQEVTN